MNLSELFIRRPVMTVLLNIAIIGLGVLGLRDIPMAALPSFDTAIINVSANMAGASPEAMANSVALPLEKQFQSISGLKSMSSSSSLGSTSVTLEFDEQRNIDAAAIDVQAALLRAQRSLPAEVTELPSYRKINPADAPILLIALTSPSLSPAELQDYAEHLISPKIASLNGIAQVNIFGAKRYAVRIKVSPQALFSRNITLDELATALKAANVNTPVGVLENAKQTLILTATQQLTQASEFAELIINNRGGNPVRLKDVAIVEDSVDVVTRFATFNGEPSIALAVQRQAGANTVEVVDKVMALLPELKKQMPKSVEITPINDRSLSVRESLHDVTLTLIGTIILVILVIFLFLRHFVATLIPALSLPISLLGAVALLWGASYSLDNISLLGLTLAVGLVVDIVVLENIMRHLEKGVSPFKAALQGSREVGFTIISISTSLIAVFIPIFFMPGLIGLLFHEFAVVVGFAIIVSAFVSLTLVPMLAAQYLQYVPTNKLNTQAKSKYFIDMRGISGYFEKLFNQTLAIYASTLDYALAYRKTVLLTTVAIFIATLYLFKVIPKGFFPEEDLGQIQVSTEAAEDISYADMLRLQEQVVAIFRQDSHVLAVTSSNGGTGVQNTGRLFIALKDRTVRPPMKMVVEQLRGKLKKIAGIKVIMRPVQNLQAGGRSSKAQYQYVLQSLNPSELNEWSNRLKNSLESAVSKDNKPLFSDVSTDSQMRSLQAKITINQERANLLGVRNDAIRTALFNAFSERSVSTMYLPTDNYAVIMQLQADQKQDESALSNVYVRSSTAVGGTGALVPLSSFVTITRDVGVSAINHVGQLQSITLSFNLPPGVSLGYATARIDELSKQLAMPTSIVTSYAGEAAVFNSSQSNQFILIIAALLVIYVLLGVF
jgi:hydrophobic/amphiphilic exporter-1 (mainly G- bacteria), HAE1 family